MREFKPYAIINPHSSNGRTGKNWPSLRDQVTSALGPVDFALTQRQGHATQLTREALGRGYDLIISVGGDGTHHEVTNGFFEGDQTINSSAALAILTSGTGGDFRKTFGLGPGPEAALAELAGDSTRPLDVGRMEFTDSSGSRRTAHFINILSFGMGGLVDHFVNTTTKALGGKASFFIGTLRALAAFRPQEVELVMDGRSTGNHRIHVVALANGRYFGGGMKIAPDADPSDGLLDVVTLENFSTPGFMALTSRIYKGTHISHPNITVQRCRELIATPVCSSPVLLDVDGESFGRLPLSVRVLPSAINLKCAAH